MLYPGFSGVSRLLVVHLFIFIIYISWSWNEKGCEVPPFKLYPPSSLDPLVIQSCNVSPLNGANDSVKQF